MDACNFPGARVIGAPQDWNHELDGPCGAIFVADHVDTLSGQAVMYSIYKPTAEELDELAKGGVIRLGIMGRGHPVFQLGVLSASLTAQIAPVPCWSLGPVIDTD